jgi:alkylation response protein AidB-like acyl-CoA dehydrogenase
VEARLLSRASELGFEPLVLRDDRRRAQELEGPERRVAREVHERDAVQTCAEVVRRVYTLAGGGAVFADSPMQRCLRDVQVATQHMMVNDASYELTGRLLLGLPTQVQTL